MHLQSITIVFLKIILANVSAMVNQVNGETGQNTGYASCFIYVGTLLTSLSEGYGGANGLSSAPGNLPGNSDSHEAIDELDDIRLREITGKAISGSLLLLLKWFKRSRGSSHS